MQSSPDCFLPCYKDLMSRQMRIDEILEAFK
jgi:hypothetical protein